MLMKPNRPALQRHHPLAASLKLVLPLSEGSGSPIELAFGMPARAIGTGVTWTRGPRGPLLEFNGDPTAYMRVFKGDHFLLMGRSWSCFAIVTRSASFSGYDPIWFSAPGSGDYKAYILIDPSGQLHRWSSFGSGFTIVPGVTYAILYTFDATSDTSGTETFYVDGARVASRTGVVPATATSYPVDLGAAGLAHGFTGTIDCPLLWVGRCLTASDARALQVDPFAVMRPSLARRLMPLGWRDAPPSVPGTATPAPAILAATAPIPVGHGGARATPTAASALITVPPMAAVGMVVAAPEAASVVVVVPDAIAVGGSGIPTLHVPRNNVYAALAVAHAQGTGTLSMMAGQGERFGIPTPEEPIRVTVARMTAFGPNGDISPDGLTIYSVPGRSGDDLVGCTPIEDTPDRDYAIGDHVAMWFTAGALADVHQTLGTLQLLPPGPHEHLASDITDFDAAADARVHLGIDDHEAADDPHVQYLRQSEADALYLTPAAADVAFLTQAEADVLFLTPSEGNSAYQPLDADLTLLATNNGSALTGLNATQLSTGTVADARLSANVPRKDVLNTWTAENRFTQGLGTGFNAFTADLRARFNEYYFPRNADMDRGWIGDYQDEASYLDKRTGVTISVTPTPAGSPSSLFRDDATTISWAASTSPWPIAIEVDMLASPIPPRGNGYFAIGMTFRSFGSVATTLPTNIKLENWASGAWSLVAQHAVSLSNTLGHWVSPYMLTGDPSSNLLKLRVTLSGSNPLGAGDTLRIQRLMIYHATCPWDPWHVHVGGGTMFGTLQLDEGNLVVGKAALATTATTGFPYIPTCPGPPTGVPTALTGRSPMVVDSTTNRLYIHVGGVWKYIALT